MKKRCSIPLLLAGSLVAVGVSAGRLPASPLLPAGVSHARSAVDGGDAETAGRLGHWASEWEKEEDGMIAGLIAVLAASLLCVTVVGVIVLWEEWGRLTNSKGHSRAEAGGPGPCLPPSLRRDSTNSTPSRTPGVASNRGLLPLRDLRAACPANYVAKVETKIKGYML
jgi:hypothetical protein